MNKVELLTICHDVFPDGISTVPDFLVCTAALIGFHFTMTKSCESVCSGRRCLLFGLLQLQLSGPSDPVSVYVPVSDTTTSRP